MISPEIIRRYPFSAGISQEKIIELAKIGKEISVEAGHYFFHEGEKVENLYLILEGEVAILIEVPDREAKTPVSEQLAGQIITKDIVVRTIVAGSLFGWAAVIPPEKTFLAAKALRNCTVVAFDAKEIQSMFDSDPTFAYQMVLRAAQILREHFRDLSIETLAFNA